MNAKKKIGVGILGGTGFGAGELLRLLATHPEVEVVSIVSRSENTKPVATVHRNLEGFYSLNFEESLNLDLLLSYECPVIFSALPHAVGLEILEDLLPEIEGSNAKVVDLSGDLRLKDLDIHKKYYPESSPSPKLRSLFTYGLPELNREEIKKSRFISNPGCYPTACTLSVLPLITSEFSGSIHFDAKSGSSGGGRSLSDFFHHPNVGSSVTAYKPLTHRHEPEIQQNLGDVSGERIRTMFVPQLLPITRGILVTSYLDLDEQISQESLLDLYRKYYADAPFVRVRDQAPSLKHVVGSNFCDVFVTARDNQVVAMAVEDNLVKGMAGQAIQNMNLICGLDETLGLWTPPLGLV